MRNRQEPDALRRLRLRLEGMVQGVGLRPFVHGLAEEVGLSGWVRNSSAGVTIEVEGAPARLAEFSTRLFREAPPHALLRLVSRVDLPPERAKRFEILASADREGVAPYILPDLALCAKCRQELFDASNRRYRHPFITCTSCGPRFSILHRLPYDRPNTSMAPFPMCEACRAEYENPRDRRFHAQPICCHDCGPRLVWWDASGAEGGTQEAALAAAVDALREGGIVAVKGLGGFHLLADARNNEAVQRLRLRKGRDGKPFAVMVPDIETARRLCGIGSEEEALLLSPAAPIVLMPRTGGALSDEIAPGLPCLGLLLPYTPLHALLLSELAFPVVATSGNRSEEPICIDEHEALRDLAGIADGFLVHNRPIVRHLDDSIVRVLAGIPTVLRRARGWAPAPLALRQPAPALLAVGAQQKNTVALAQGEQAVLSQHLGDLDSEKACSAFERAQGDLKALYAIEPETVAHDLHPDYAATRHAKAIGAPLVAVQHHHAHIVACLAEHGLPGPVLGIAMDGTGAGPDGTVWGGEFLLADEASFRRVATLRDFPLLGGERAVREPRRVALALLWKSGLLARAEALGLESVSSFTPAEKALLLRMLERNLQSPQTSSAGRLFDGVASLLGLCQQCRFEGEAAMRLEALAAKAHAEEDLPFEIDSGEEAVVRLDWAPMVNAMLAGLETGRDRAGLALQFHQTLAAMSVAVARRAGCRQVVLSGGCFQNAILVACVESALRAAGFEVLRHRLVPPNDGGIALGQLVSAAARSNSQYGPCRLKAGLQTGENPASNSW